MIVNGPSARQVVDSLPILAVTGLGAEIHPEHQSFTPCEG